jgi:F-type H+-transporting ATPase subunit b
MSFLSIDGTLVIQLINFAIFLAILRVIFLRPVAAAIRKRREYINGLTTDYERYQAEAKVLRDQAESVRAAARRDTPQRTANAPAQASNEAAELAATYARKAQGVTEEAARTVAAEYVAAQSGEDRIVAALAHMMLDRVTAEAG